ncbi:MAG: hypothetical protein CM15mP12_1780 [Gammaproteobacteria bacterium]|nr:MAG: hypothetical protein CM15mP12_1780 [Gammaproteobacteria bacterium]
MMCSRLMRIQRLLIELGHSFVELDFFELSSGICSYYVIAPQNAHQISQDLRC